MEGRHLPRYGIEPIDLQVQMRSMAGLRGVETRTADSPDLSSCRDEFAGIDAYAGKMAIPVKFARAKIKRNNGVAALK